MNRGDVNFAFFVVILGLYAVVAYGTLTSQIRDGNPWRAAIAAWFASPIPLFFTAGMVEQRNVLHLLDPRIQSWALLFGDLVFLPFMAAMLAKAWRHLDQQEIRMRKGPISAHIRPQKQWHHTTWWWLAAAVVGVLLGVLFHLWDGAHYVHAAWVSPSKLVHDFCAFPVLGGGLFYGLIPALFGTSKSRKIAMIAVGCVLTWLGLEVTDNFFHHLDGRNMHDMFDYVYMRTIPYPDYK